MLLAAFALANEQLAIKVQVIASPLVDATKSASLAILEVNLALLAPKIEGSSVDALYTLS